MQLWGPSTLIQRLYQLFDWYGMSNLPPLRGGPNTNARKPWNIICNPSCRNICRLFIHDKKKFGPLGFTLLVSKWTWNAMVTGLQSRVWSGPYWAMTIELKAITRPSSVKMILDGLSLSNQWEILECNGRGPSNLMCKVAPLEQWQLNWNPSQGLLVSKWTWTVSAFPTNERS